MGDEIRKIVTLYTDDANPDESWVKLFADSMGAEFRVEKKPGPTREELKQAFSDQSGGSTGHGGINPTPGCE